MFKLTEETLIYAIFYISSIAGLFPIAFHSFIINCVRYGASKEHIQEYLNHIIFPIRQGIRSFGELDHDYSHYKIEPKSGAIVIVYNNILRLFFIGLYLIIVMVLAVYSVEPSNPTLERIIAVTLFTISVALAVYALRFGSGLKYIVRKQKNS